MATKRKAKKNINGEGSIKYRSDRRHWTVAVTIDGKRVQRVAHTHEEAIEIRNGLIADGVDGMVPADGSVTVSQWFKQWMRDAMPRSVSMA